MFGVFAYVVYDDDNADRDDIKYMKPVYYIYICIMQIKIEYNFV